MAIFPKKIVSRRHGERQKRVERDGTGQRGTGRDGEGWDGIEREVTDSMKRDGTGCGGTGQDGEVLDGVERDRMAWRDTGQDGTET